jgi:nitrate/nitrite transporter NarK
LLALPFMAAVFLLDRRDRLGRRRALLVALAGGAAGNVALLLHCPLVSRDHIFAGHTTVPVFLALLLCTLVWYRHRGA